MLHKKQYYLIHFFAFYFLSFLFLYIHKKTKNRQVNGNYFVRSSFFACLLAFLQGTNKKPIYASVIIMLAMSAAPFDTQEFDNYLSSKRNNHTKTQRKNVFDSDIEKNSHSNSKVNYILDKIHGQPEQNEKEEMGAFMPPPKPISSGVMKTQITNQNQLQQHKESFLGHAPTPAPTGEDLEINNYNHNYKTEKMTKEYYSKMVPGYNNNNNNNNNSNDMLLKKINYIIHMLEEQQDEKTNNVLEEVILYIFLGIFMIFIVESFTKVGKYIR